MNKGPGACRCYIISRQSVNFLPHNWLNIAQIYILYVFIVNDHTTCFWHYDDVIMTMLASQITSLTVVYSIVYSGVNQRKHQSSASLAFVREIHRGPVNFPHKWPVTRKMLPFDDVIMTGVEISLRAMASCLQWWLILFICGPFY